eukprot:CAMPEP_0117418926 /NCGR_PEP_ID=MMETSP0758-20121206/608_1 /TAXON_ID=63605 /ORGANISM="Percolomonas cosmopolitus, Strain AE-1 (ATCC 50343)" /LENGTH=508 /DNA_ID=CAMNT_0005199719 /DNA_START=547 /DNA_END=2070 /DNA_ORIENTATION=-
MTSFVNKMKGHISPVSPMTVTEDKYAYSPSKHFNVDVVNKTDVIKIANIGNIKLNFEKMKSMHASGPSTLDSARRLESPTLQKQDSLSKLFRHMPPSALLAEDIHEDDEESDEDDDPPIPHFISSTPRPKKGLRIDTSRIHSARRSRIFSARTARPSSSCTPKMSSKVFNRLTKKNKKKRHLESSSLSNVVFSGEVNNVEIPTLKGKLRPMSARPALQSTKHSLDLLTPRCKKLNLVKDSSSYTNSAYEFAYKNHQMLEKKMIHYIPTGTDDDDKGTKNVFVSSTQARSSTTSSSPVEKMQEKEWMFIFEYLDGVSLYHVSLSCRLFYTAIFNAYFMGRRLKRRKEIYLRWQQSQIGDTTIYMEDINRIQHMLQRIPDGDFVFLADQLSSLEPYAKQAVLLVCRTLFPKKKSVRSFQQKLKSSQFRKQLDSYDIEHMTLTTYSFLRAFMSDLSSIPEEEAKSIAHILHGTDKLLLEGSSSSSSSSTIVSSRITRNKRIQTIIHLFILW